MAVEILILSGARQNERLVFTSSAFEVGDAQGVDVHFDPAQDPHAQGRSLSFHRNEDGWRVRNTGAGVPMVDYDPVESEAAIRSGSIVRLSDSGPDFEFNVISDEQASVIQASLASARPMKEETAAVGAAPAPDEGAAAAAAPDPIAPGDDLPPPPPPQHPADSPADSPAWASPITITMTIAAVAGVAVLLGLFFALGPSGGEPVIVLPKLEDQVVDEGDTLELSAGAVDWNDENGELVYRLEDGGPQGAVIDGATGDIRWTPAEEQGPNQFTFIVGASVAEPAKAEKIAEATEVFHVRVNEKPQPPVVAPPLRTKVVLPEASVDVRLTARDPDIPSSPLQYRLEASAPEGAAIDSQGRVTWQAGSQPPGTYTIPIEVVKQFEGAEHIASTELTVDVLEEEDPWQKAFRLMQPNLYLLSIKDDRPPGSVFPFATATAIGPDTLLTSASVALELEKHRRNNLTPVAVSMADSREIPIASMKIFEPYLKEQSPVERLFLDFAVLKVEGGLPGSAQLATRDEMAQVKQGDALMALPIPHAGIPLEATEEPPQPRRVNTTVERITKIEEDDARNFSTVIDVKGTFPANVYGAPLVNQSGKVVALYTEKKLQPDDVSGTPTHYAALAMMPSLFAQGAQGTLWVEPPAELPGIADKELEELAPTNPAQGAESSPPGSSSQP